MGSNPTEPAFRARERIGLSASYAKIDLNPFIFRINYGIAVKVSSRWLTGKRSEALDALPVIMKLARDTLDPNEFNEAEDISKALVGTKKTKK